MKSTIKISIKSKYCIISFFTAITLLCNLNAYADFLPRTAIDTVEIPQISLTASDADTKPLPYFQLSENTYFLYGNIAEIDEKNRGFNGNAGFVVTTDGVVVIDSLGTPKLGNRLIATIKSVTSKPIKYLVITHNHPDHSYGAVAFKQLPNLQIIGHSGTLKYLESDSLQQSISFRNTILPEDMKGFNAEMPDILIGGQPYEHYSFSLGGKTFAIYNTGQHHSYGDLVIHQVEDRQLWISDLAFNNRSTYMGDGHSAEVLHTIDWMKNKFTNIKLMIPGHGSAQTPPFSMVDKTYQYVKRLRDEMDSALKSGKDLATSVKQSDFKDWHSAPLYHENHKKNANFIYLELEQEAF